MCGNPFKIGDNVDGDFEVEEYTTSFINIDSNILIWRVIEGMKVLTLDEILEQTIKYNKNHREALGEKYVPFIRVVYETGLWGVIFEVGNYPPLGKQWIVHGITKGYA